MMQLTLKKAISLSALLTLLILGGLVSTVQAKVSVNESTNVVAGKATDVKQISDLMTAYQNILNNANAANIKDVYTKDGTFIGQGFPTAIGQANIENLYSDFLSKLDFDIEFNIIEITLENDYGYIQTISRGTIVPKGQTAKNKEANREIFIVKKVNEQWKIHRYIFTSEVK